MIPDGDAEVRALLPAREDAPAIHTFGGDAGEVRVVADKLVDAGSSFEPQRNLMGQTYALDGGGSVAADKNGNVYVVWRDNRNGGLDLFLRRSTNNGSSFGAETRIDTGDAGTVSARAVLPAPATKQACARSPVGRSPIMQAE